MLPALFIVLLLNMHSIKCPRGQHQQRWRAAAVV